MSRFLYTASVIALAAVPATAQEAMDLEMITVFANQSQTDLSRTGASVEVVEEDALETAPQTRLADYLNTLPGVSVSSNGGIGGTTTVRVRGLSGAYVPVLINGIDVTDPSAIQSSFDWANLVMGDIARVEVVKGSQSALYGSEAIGGVIAITTARAPEEPGTTVDLRAEYGSDNTRRANLGVSTAGARGGLSFNLARTQTDGFSAIEAAGFSEDDGYDGTQLTFDGYFDVTPDLRLGLSGYALRSEAEFDSGPFAAQPESGLAETDTQALRAYAELTTGAVDHVFDVTRYRTARDSTANGATSSFEGMRDGVSYKATTDLSAATTLSFGADWTREEADAAEETTVTGVFAEALFAPRADLDIGLSLRHDQHSEFGGQTSGRLALAWRPMSDLTFRAVLSNGFRAPSLYELYDPTYGNTGLEAEKSRNAEIGVEKTFGNGASAQATVFYTEIDNLIGFSFPAGYVQTSGTTVTQGLELSGEVPVGERVEVTGSFTYTDSRTPSDDPALRVPRYDLSLGVTAQLTDRLSGSMNIQHVADLPDDFNAGFALAEVEDYTLVNVSFDYEVIEGVNAYLRVENLTDADYQVIPDYQTSGRAAYFGVVASF